MKFKRTPKKYVNNVEVDQSLRSQPHRLHRKIENQLFCVFYFPLSMFDVDDDAAVECVQTDLKLSAFHSTQS